MFLLRRLRFRTLGIILVVLSVLAVIVSVFVSGNHGDDVEVLKRQSEDASVAATLPISDIINSQTLSPVKYTVHVVY